MSKPRERKTPRKGQGEPVISFKKAAVQPVKANRLGSHPGKLLLIRLIRGIMIMFSLQTDEKTNKQGHPKTIKEINLLVHRLPP
jgi:hypothetical protein